MNLYRIDFGSGYELFVVAPSIAEALAPAASAFIRRNVGLVYRDEIAIKPEKVELIASRIVMPGES